MITHVFFDLDNTLYPKSSLLLKEVNDLITKFVASYLSISEEQALSMRQNRGDMYPTTYGWLTGEHNFTDIDAYMDAVHPKNLDDYLIKDSKLKETLLGLNKHISVLTNSPIEHATRVLEYLEIVDCFEHVFDLKRNNYIGKPDHEIMRSNVIEAGGTPKSSLLVDDMPGHVLSFVEMGGYGLVIDEDKTYKGPMPTIASVLDLTEEYIDGLEGFYMAGDARNIT